MSGWDVSSTPTWGQEDGPDDNQAFTASGEGGARDHGQDFGAPDFGGGYSGEGAAAGPPPEFFGQDYGQDQNMDLGPGGFPQRTPGRSLHDLPRREMRGRYGSAPAGGYGQESAFGRDTGYGQDAAPAYGQEASYGRDDGFDQDGPTQRLETFYGQGSGYGQDAGYGQGSASGQSDAFDQGGTFRQDSAFGQDAGFGQDNSFRQDAAFGQDAGFGQDNSFRQDGAPGRDAAFGQDWGGGADQAQPDRWGQGGQDNDGGWGRTAGRSAAPWDERSQQDPGYGGADGFGRQDFGRQPESLGFSAKDYAGQDMPGQQGRGAQESPDFGRTDRDMSAMNDPALQDFFSPTRGGGFSGQGPGRSGGEPGERFTQAPGDWAKPRGGEPGERFSQAPADWAKPRGSEPGERFSRASADWANPGRSSAPRTGTGPRGPVRDDPKPRRGLGAKGFAAIGAVVIVIIAVVAYMFIGHKSSGSSTAGNTPSGTTTTPAVKPTGSKAAGASGTTPAYTLSTPSTAGGYAIGQDPSFLSMATTTAGQISTAVTSGGGGTVTGKPVSAAYTLPQDQVITFVGYEGSFTPAKVKTILASLGSDSNTFPAGSLGGVLGCANTTTSPSGAVCVWSDSSTLGITEFFGSTGPETLSPAPSAEQKLGATDTVNLRADVEKKAS